MDVVKARIVERLRGTGPAPDPEAEARAALAPVVAQALFPKPLVRAAVLLGLVEHPAGLTVLLTRRSEHLQDHPGQISLPGGRIDAQDAGPLAAALREFQEELGLASGAVEVAGYLPVHPVITGFVVTPVVGFLPEGLAFRPDAFEVAEVFEVPLEFVLDPANVTVGRRQVHGIEIAVCEYQFGPYRIWGATAQILKSLVDKINRNNG